MSRVVLFGATGYQGGLTARAMLARGIAPLLVGRSRKRLAAQAAELGGLEYAEADASDRASLRRVLERGDVLVTTVGPFVRYGAAQVEAAIEKGAHYLDSCGESPFYHRLPGYDAAARRAGSAVLTACAYDFFPGNLAADRALELAGPSAVRVVIGYAGEVAPGYQVSAGSRASGMVGMLEAAAFYRGGELVFEPIGQRFGHFELHGARLPGISMGGTEALFLPELYPQLRDIDAYWGWANGGSRALHFAFKTLGWIAKNDTTKRWLGAGLGRLAKSDGSGPSENLRERSTSYVCATTYDAAGRPLTAVELGDIDGHTFTANILAWAADTLRSGGLQRAGVTGPVQAFGRSALQQGHEQAGFQLTASTY